MVSISISVDARTLNDIHEKCKTNAKRDFIMSYGKSNSNDKSCPSDHTDDYCTKYSNAYNSQLDTMQHDSVASNATGNPCNEGSHLDLCAGH
jgi:hypothetical protein